MALTEDDVRSMKVTQLRAQCDELGINKKGLKVGHIACACVCLGEWANTDTDHHPRLNW